MQGKAFSELPLSAKKQILQKELSCHKFPPYCFISQGELTDQKRENWKLTSHPDTLCHQLSCFPFILLRVNSCFLKVIYSPLRGLYILLSPIKMKFKSKF